MKSIDRMRMTFPKEENRSKEEQEIVENSKYFICFFFEYLETVVELRGKFP